jgi:hypothetical protein
LICVPSGANLPDTLINTPIIQSEDGSGLPSGYSASAFAFGINPEDDPELAMVCYYYFYCSMDCIFNVIYL